jgi:hypothetical protein
MSTTHRVNELFHELLESFAGGIANTSTSKYNSIKRLLAEEFALSFDDIYATGATTRISNLDTRLAQGNQRGQHAPLALVFLKLETRESETREAALERIRGSILATCKKFVSGEERGTTFDGILCFVQLDGEEELQAVQFIRNEQCAYAERVIRHFPDAEEVVITSVRHSTPAAPPPVVREPGLVAAPEMTDLLQACASDLSAGGVRLPQGHLGRYLASLLTKRFVILAGLSGSGKTKLALAVAKWFEEIEGQAEIVAVGADWTTNENVLGYRDALDPTKYRAPASGALDIILRAAKDPSRPYFLILDEMNLSHVERYFSDILSAIESGQPVALHAADGEVDGVPSRLLLPKNLFIVGTVNVDETTYMFSPKVLDRANVLEFRVSSDDIAAYLAAPADIDLDRIAGRGLMFGPQFVTTASSPAPQLTSLATAIADGVAAKAMLDASLVRIFQTLSPMGAEFGFRAGSEVLRFAFLHANLVGPGWRVEDSIDAQLVQKLMPKLHGSERRLRPILQKLGEYATEMGLPLSLEKVTRMQDRLRDGFASFLD